MITGRETRGKLFVGNLQKGTDDDGLASAFARFGRISDTRVIREVGATRSCDYGFVTFADSKMSKIALAIMNGSDLHGRAIIVAQTRCGKLQNYPRRKRFQGYRSVK